MFTFTLSAGDTFLFPAALGVGNLPDPYMLGVAPATTLAQKDLGPPSAGFGSGMVNFVSTVCYCQLASKLARAEAFIFWLWGWSCAAIQAVGVALATTSRGYTWYKRARCC